VTAAEIREALERNADESARLGLERSALTLALEEMEGRPDSSAAKFARAHLAGDLAAMDVARVEGIAAYVRQYGHAPDEEVRVAALAEVAKDDEGGFIGEGRFLPGVVATLDAPKGTP